MSTPSGVAATTRDRILDAAAVVMRVHGLAHTTTKKIAQEVGLSEAALYKHFPDKTALFVAVLSERAPSRLPVLLAGLRSRVGTEPVEAVLTDVAREAIAFYRDTFPAAASVFADAALLAAHRSALAERGSGPHVVTDTVASYLAAERDAGRLDPTIDGGAAAALLTGACLQYGFLDSFAAAAVDTDTIENRARAVVRHLLDGLGR